MALIATRVFRDNSGTGTVLTTPSFTPANAGSLIVLGICLEDTGAGNPTVTAVQLDGTTAFTSDITRQNGSTDSRIYIQSLANVAASSHTINLTRNSAQTRVVMYYLEFSAAQTGAGYQDGAGASATSTSTNPASGTFTASVTDGIWVALFANENGSSDTTVAAGAAGPTWVMDATDGRTTDTNHIVSGIETSINPGSAGAFNGNFVAASAQWAAAVFVYKAAAAGTTIAVPVGSEPMTGRVLGLGFGINMPDVP